MSRYTFLEGAPGPEFKTTFTGFLFNQPRHILSQSREGWSLFSLADIPAKQIVARVYFHLENEIASSPHKAPFGSVEFGDDLPSEMLGQFFESVENSMIKKGAKKIVIKDAPQIYRPHLFPVLASLLAEMNYKVVNNEISSIIVVDEVDWKDKIVDAELRRLKKCEKEQLSVQLMDMMELESVYNFINECRKERRQSLSMSYESLRQTIENCPRDFLLFGVFQGKQLIASSISVQVTDSILYNFYPAHKKSADQLSPLVFLLNNQYVFCRAKGIHLLDLGTSTVDGKTNLNLLNFKTNVGGTPSLKFTFEKTLQ